MVRFYVDFNGFDFTQQDAIDVALQIVDLATDYDGEYWDIEDIIEDEYYETQIYLGEDPEIIRNSGYELVQKMASIVENKCGINFSIDKFDYYINPDGFIDFTTEED